MSLIDGNNFLSKHLFDLSTRLQEFKNLLPKGVNLLAVSKGHSTESIRFLSNNGQLEFGESRLQEAVPKILKLSDIDRIRWHFIGRLQANKVRKVVQICDFIHSVDSLTLAERISRICEEENRSPKVMIQVKFLEDPTKGGFSISELEELWPKLTALPHLNMIGLMTILPIGLDSDIRKKLFKNCRNFSDSLGLKDCSMGMSGDWQEAVEAGATWIRVGSLLFGERVK